MHQAEWLKLPVCSNCRHSGRFLFPPGRMTGLLGMAICPRCEEPWESVSYWVGMLTQPT